MEHLTSLYIAIVAVWVADLSPIPFFIKKFRYIFFKTSFLNRIKPFDCPLCLGFWLGLSYALIHNFKWEVIIFTILTSFLSSVLSSLYKRMA